MSINWSINHGGPESENTTTFQITEKVGQRFLFVIGQKPSAWRQLNVISWFYFVQLSAVSLHEF